MAKKSQRRNVRHEKDHSGCMSGLISIFDFRQGRFTQKFLSDKRHRNGRHAVGAGYSRSRVKLSNSDEKLRKNDGGDESKTLEVDIGKTSVKKLMEKELSREHQTKKNIPSTAVEEIRYKYGHDSKASASLESHANSIEQFSHLDLASLMEEFCSQIHYRQEIHLHHENGGGSDTFDVQRSTNSLKHNQLDELDMQLVQKHSILQQKLSEAAEAFLNQKFIDAKQLSQDEATHQSKQFMDALEILNSNKELLLKLLQDSNSLLVKHIQDLRDAQSEKVGSNKLSAGAKLLEEETGDSSLGEELVCRKKVEKPRMHNFFKRKIKSESRNPSKGSDTLIPSLRGVRNSATVAGSSLSTQSHYGRFNSQFSLNEIKRKLKHAMGENKKERHWISMDGILHKIPYKHQDLGNGGKGIAGKIVGRESHSMAHVDIKRKTETSTISKKDKKGKPTHYRPQTTDGQPKQRETNIYIEAKKHLAKMLSNGDEEGDLLIPQVRDRDDSFISAQMRFFPHGNFQIADEDIWWPNQGINANHLSPSVTDNDDNPEIKHQDFDSNPDTSEELLPDTKINITMRQGIVAPSQNNNDDNSGTEPQEVDLNRDTSEIQENICSSRGNLSPKGGVEIQEIIGEEEGSFESLRLDSPTEDQPPSSSLRSFSPSTLLVPKVKTLESINDGLERPSPVSVLDPFFLEEVISPASTASQLAELPMQPRRIHFEEHEYSTLVVTPSYSRTCIEDKKPTFEYVRAVIQASGFNWDEFLGKSHSSHQPLDPSLFDEVDILSSEHCDDRKPIFDCINEVLLELYVHYFGCSPWVVSVNPNIRPTPTGKKLVREVWEGIDWHLNPKFVPRTLDEIVGKDMEKARTWMDLRFDVEGICSEIEEDILEELMDNAILDLCG